MEAVVRRFDRPPDRAAGVVDQDVDVTMVLEDPVDHRFASVKVGQVGGVYKSAAALAFDLLLQRLELFGRA